MQDARFSRRWFIKRTLQTGAALTTLTSGVAAYGFYEASQIRIRQEVVALPNLPKAFEGKTIGVLTDFHHGPWVSIQFIREAVNLANRLKPDLFCLLGDYAHKGLQCDQQLPPCLEALSALHAPLGVYAVPGNHDMKNRGQIYQEVIATLPLVNLVNTACAVTHQGETLWLAGVDDLWWGKPNLNHALAEVPPDAAVVLLSHNPDFAEENPDSRVGLILSGHTHGGQVYVPGINSRWLPSRYGMKYRSGFVAGPKSTVFVSRGLGEAGIPIRLNVPPEINLLTLIRPT